MKQRNKMVDLEIFTTFNLSAAICHLTLKAHHSRLSRQAALFGWVVPQSDVVQKLIERDWTQRNKPQLCRISTDGQELKIQFRNLNPTASRPLCRSISLILTSIQIHPFYGIIKCNQRQPYIRAMQLAVDARADEALLVDVGGNIVDGTRSSPIAVDRTDPNHLIVPMGGLQGITRGIYIQSRSASHTRGSISCRYIHASDFKKYDWIMCGSGIGVVHASAA